MPQSRSCYTNKTDSDSSSGGRATASVVKRRYYTPAYTHARTEREREREGPRTRTHTLSRTCAWLRCSCTTHCRRNSVASSLLSSFCFVHSFAFYLQPQWQRSSSDGASRRFRLLLLCCGCSLALAAYCALPEESVRGYVTVAAVTALLQ